MATAEQIRANRQNASKSTGPRSREGKDKARFNGLKHGLRAEQVVIPGEDPADFEAERSAWFEDWRPRSHTRAVLVERAALAAWRLRRCVRAEAARLHGPGGDAADAFDADARQLLGWALSMLPRDPGAALSRLRADPVGLDCLIGLWAELADAAEPGRWTSRADHHERLLNLLGHRAGSEAERLEAARASRDLLRARRPGEAPTPGTSRPRRRSAPSASSGPRSSAASGRGTGARRCSAAARSTRRAPRTRRRRSCCSATRWRTRRRCGRPSAS